MTSALAYLEQFAAEAQAGPLGIPYSHTTPGSDPSAPHVVFGFIVHGNENGSLPAALALLRALQRGELKSRSTVSLFLGNPEACKQDVRFLDEDLNRVFTFDRSAQNHERRRAEELRPLLDQADFFLDFHQTQNESLRAFWTFPYRREFAAWARALQVSAAVLTRPDGQAFSPGLRCLDEYVRDRGKVGLTVELGEKGLDPLQALRAEAAAKRVLALLDEQAQGVSLEQQAAREGQLEFYQTYHVLPGAQPERRLKPGLFSWSRVEEGELLSEPGVPEIRAPQAGYVLFPKYVEPGQTPPPDLVRIAAPITEAALSPR